MSSSGHETKLRVTADTSQAQTAVKNLQKSFGGMLSDAGSAAVKLNQSLELIEKGMAAVRYGIGAMKFKEEMDRLSTAIPTETLEKLDRATGGAVARLDLLRLASKNMTGDFALSAKQMELVMQAAQALEQRGYGPVTEIAGRLTEAVKKNVGKLDDFGISLKKTGDRQVDVNSAMSKFQELVDNTAPISEQARTIRDLESAFRTLADGIKYAVASAIEGIARVSMEILGIDPEGERSKTAGLIYKVERAQAANAAWEADFARRYVQTVGKSYVLSDRTSSSNIALGSMSDADRAQAIELAKSRGITIPGIYEPKKATASGGKAGGNAWDSFVNNLSFDAYRGRGLSDYDAVEFALAEAGMGPGQSAEIDAWLKKNGGDGALAAGSGVPGIPSSTVHRSQITAIEQMVEALKPMDMQLTMVSRGWGLFESAIGSAVDAAITGQKSIGAAVAETTTNVLKTIAIEATVQAAKEGALALGSLALGPIGGVSAGAHAASAAKWAAVAALAGGGAAALGRSTGQYGGGGGGVGAGAGGGYVGRQHQAPGSGGEGSTIVIHVGDGFVGDAKGLAAEIDSKLRAGRRAGRISDGSRVVRFG
jgi:hypothetical protein